ncbi:MAG TPA: GAF domain-containing sensor histidine kinase [Chloroflexia bacterium]|nr:GAF domain-containing sensor histidine kinase [Chloroflexia bacterium]
MFNDRAFKPLLPAEGDSPNGEQEGSPLLLVGLLTLLRFLTAGAAAATLALLAHEGSRPLPWADPIAGGLLLLYVMGACLVFALVYLAPRHSYWLIDLGLLFDLAILIALSLVTGGATVALVLPALFAIGIIRNVWAALLAVTMFGLHLVPIWPPAHELATLPQVYQAVLFGLFTILSLVWVSLVAGSNAQLVRQHARKATRNARQAVERYRLALQRAKGVYHVTYTLSATLNYESVLRTIFEEFVRVLPFDVGMVLLVEPSTRMLVVSGSYGLAKDEIDRKLDGRTGQLGRAASSGTPVIIKDLTTEPELVACWPRLARFSHAMIIPLRSRFELYGIIVTAVEKGKYEQDQLELLTALGNNAIIALQNAQLYQALRDERDRLLGKEDEVRRQLARDLHDGPAQTLAAIAMNADFIKKLLASAPDRVAQELDELSDMARKANQDVRTLLFELRPVILESSGLVVALSQYVQRFPASEMPRVHFEGQELGVRLAPAAETTVFNVVQESINNAKKHARARNIWVQLRTYSSKLMITIQDDGQGFDVSEQQDEATKRGSYGLLNMRERAESVDGEIGITSVRGRGTSVTLTVPLLSA